MTAHELRDAWAVSGDELEQFKETIADITNSTYGQYPQGAGP